MPICPRCKEELNLYDDEWVHNSDGKPIHAGPVKNCRALCAMCGEYIFDKKGRDASLVGDALVCISCEPQASRRFRRSKRIKNLFLSFACLLILACGGYGIFSFSDSYGYIQHSVETAITAQANWLVGESKDCTSVPLTADSATVLGKEAGDVASLVTCDDGPLHDMKVTFYGRMQQPEHKIIYWRCTRNDETFSAEGFTCRQTGAD